MPGHSISIVICSYQRLAALRVGLPEVLKIQDVEQVVVVVDGSTDGTAQWLDSWDEPRLRVVVLPENRGLPYARNTGVLAATSDWILFLDDDILAPPSYARDLLAVAVGHGAQLVSAPWVSAKDGQDIEQMVREARQAGVREFSLETGPGVFPLATIQTPFLNSYMLVDREVFFGHRFDESIRGNAYREETTFTLNANRLGHKSVVTPDTYTYQYETFDGGCHDGPRWRYEVSLFQNNWRFLARHRTLLRQQEIVEAPIRSQVVFVARRIWTVALAVVRSRVGRARATRTP